MALTTYTKNNVTTTALNLAGAWTGGLIPAVSTDSQVLWNSTSGTVNNALGSGGSTTWGQISVTNTTGTCQISFSVGSTLTLTPTSYSNIGVELTNASAVNFTLTATTALGSSQSWKVASGRTLTVTGVISGATSSLTKSDAGTLSFTTGVNTFGSGGGQTFTAAAGLTTTNAVNSLGSSLNTVVINNGASIQFNTAVPAQTVFNVTGPGNTGRNGALSTTVQGWSGKTITAGTDTVIAFRGGGVYSMTLALGSGVTGITLNGENTGVSDASGYTFSIASAYPATGTATVTLASLDRDGITARGIKYSIGSAAGVTDANNSGGGGLGVNGNSIVVAASGGILSASASGTFNRNYTFDARGARQASINQFKMTAASGTTTFATNTLTFSGSYLTDYVQFAGSNTAAAIIKLDGTITGGANLDVGSNGVNGSVDATLELGSNLVSSGWASTAGLTVNYLRYGKSLENANPLTFTQSTPVIDNVSGGALTVRHSSYANNGTTSLTFTGSNNLTMTGPVAGSANWTTSPGTWTVSANTLTLGFNFTGSGSFIKAGTGTMVLTGSNTGLSSCTINAGTLVLNNNDASGPSAANFVFAATNTTIDSTTGAILTAAGTVNLGAFGGGFTWKGTNNLTFPGTVTHGGSRTITFVNGATGILTFAGPLNTTTLTYLWNVGGGVAGARNVLYIANTNASLATTGQVTAGYLRAGNAASLGAVGTTTAWTVSSGAAIELIGSITVPSSKNFNGVGTGPNLDGALRAVSGANNRWQGQISITTATGARIQVDAGTFTLDNTTHTGINAPAGTNTTPITFTAQSSAVLNQDRILAAGFSTVAIANGPGTVVLSKANLHSGAMTCSAGTTKLTNVAAVGAGAGNSVTVTAGATMESAVKAVFPATLTLGNTGTPAIFKISA
jgi:hypothetical protein